MLRRLLIALVPIGGLLLVLQAVTLPYFVESPGPAREVQSLIRISGHPRYPSGGRFVMTAVSFRPVNAYGALRAWLDPARSVVPESVLVAPGETEEQANQRSVSEMDQSKIDAAYVVLPKVTAYPKRHGPGVLIESVVPGCSAEGKLFPGDLIEKVDGRDVTGPRAFSKLLQSTPPGTRIHMGVTAAGETHHVVVSRRMCGGGRRPVVGVFAIPAFPFPVSISSGDIGGPSAGLMWALGLYDVLTPGDLTGGRTIAGTGEIDLRGRVYPIGGVQDKVLAAKRAGATVFLVPRGNFAEARERSSGITLVPVARLSDALGWLRSHA